MSVGRPVEWLLGAAASALLSLPIISVIAVVVLVVGVLGDRESENLAPTLVLLETVLQKRQLLGGLPRRPAV